MGNCFSAHRLGFGKLPRSVDDFRTWTVEANHVVPTGGDGQAVRGTAIALAKADCHRAVRVLLGSDVVQRVRVQLVRFEISLSVVDADGPEGIDRNVLDVELNFTDSNRRFDPRGE